VCGSYALGANRGIGLQLVRTLLQRGYTVWGTIRSQSKQNGSAQDLYETGAKILEVDYLDEQSIINAVKSLESFGKLDVLINNGGRLALLVEYASILT